MELLRGPVFWIAWGRPVARGQPRKLPLAPGRGGKKRTMMIMLEEVGEVILTRSF